MMETPMDLMACIIVAALLGAAVGFSVTYLFKILPESWLQDYGYDEKAPDFRLAKRMKLVPHGVISAVFCTAAYVSTVVSLFERYFLVFRPFHICVILLLVPVVVIVMMSDRLNRIIPDECSLFILILGILAYVGDITEKTYWFSNDTKWYIPLLNRVIAMVAGYGLLWIINFLCVTFLGKEGMGQGDMKLLGACGFLVGCYGIIVLLYVGFVSALFFAIPLFIRKRIRIAREKKEIANSEDPAAKRREIAIRKKNMHFADDPDYLAFGPFLAFGAVVYLAFEGFFYWHLIGFFIISGLTF